MTHITDKLYDKAPYDSTFTARVTDVIADSGKTAIVLDRTLFFPEGGGQTSDRGVLRFDNNIYDVYDVQIEEDIIYHYIEGDVTTIGESLQGKDVEGEIDFKYRFSNMQQHSAEHIFSGLASKHYGCTNVGFHLSDNEVTFDYDKALSEEQITFLETQTNKVIYENRSIRAYYPSEEELLSLDYRSKKEIEGDVRLVEIEGVDLCACCAPHVRYTGEIGICKVVDCMNYKGGIRISILCGDRALEHYRRLDTITRDIGRSLSAKREDIPKEIDRLNGAYREIEYKYIESQKRYLDLIYDYIDVTNGDEANNSLGKYKTFANVSVREETILLRLDDFDVKPLRDMVNRLKARYPYKLIVVTTSSNKGINYIIASDDLDCRRVATILREKYDAKGGGSLDMIQGTLNRELDDEDMKVLCDGVR